MKAARGDITRAAQALGCPAQNLRNRISQDPQLKAVYSQRSDTVQAPTELNTLLRDGPPIPSLPDTNVESALLTEALIKQNKELMYHGLEKSGIKPKTLELLRSIEGLSAHSGIFMVNTMEIAHKMSYRQAIALFERGEYIKEHYLENEMLDDEIKIAWQKEYTRITDQLVKFFDRTVVATQALLAMEKARKDSEGSGKKKKMAFTPKVKPEAPPKTVQ